MNKKKFDRVFITAALLLVAVTLASFCIGKYPLDLNSVIAIITGKETNTISSDVFFKLRLPRSIMALLAGAGLGLAGAVYQIIFKNPLASPDIIGISAGSNLGAAIAIVLSSYSMTAVGLGAFAGGLLSVACVMLLVKSTKTNTTATYVLSGIIISSVAKAFIMLLKYYADSESQLAAIEYWTMGSLASMTLSKLLGILPFWIIGFSGTILLHRQIALLGLNEDECRSLGVRLAMIRIIVLCFSTLLVASVISVTGLISFSGLIAPHIAYFITKKRDRIFLIMSSFSGASVILISDICARSLSSAEIPLSILTTIIGVPVLVFFMIKRSGGKI